MLKLDDIGKTLESYNETKIHVATIGSHSALNILVGARDEGLPTVCICDKKGEMIYRRLKAADKIIVVDNYKDILNEDIQEKLRSLNAVIVPHGSFNAYVGAKELETEFNVPIFGNRVLLRWESSRDLQRKWLDKAGLKLPRLYDSPRDIDSLVIIKFPGAKGGKGYFIADSEESYHKKMGHMIKNGLVSKGDAKRAHIQEYIVGVSVYPHYFYSPLKETVEFMGVDKRYESSVDGINRIPAPEQLESKLNPSFTVVGNFPLVLRESLLPGIFDMGDRIADVSKKIAPPGLIGPFCLETICTEKLDLIAFEISARIVAGCNVAIGSSPYSHIVYGEPMYMGKRIARELKNAVKTNSLDRVVT